MDENNFLKKSRWKNLRNRILRRDKYLCQYFLRYGKNIEATHVHHIFPVEIYPEYKYCDWNLISLSQKAHNIMHVRNSHELTDERVLLSLDLKKAYEEEAGIKTYSRTFDFDKKTAALRITDDVSLEEATNNVDVHFLTYFPVEIKDGKVSEN